MITRLRYPKGYQFFDKNGDPLSLGNLYYYQAGTTTLQDTYLDDEGTIANTNPLVLDGSGRLTTDIYLGSIADYKEVLTSSSATVSPWPADDIPHASASESGGGGTPGGSSGQIQYNSADAFAGVTNSAFDGTTLSLPYLKSNNTPTITGSGASRVGLYADPLWTVDVSTLDNYTSASYDLAVRCGGNASNTDASAATRNDVTMHLGFNVAPNGYKKNTSDASLMLSWESCYWQGGTASDSIFEFHLQEYTIQGTSKRPLSFMLPRNDTYTDTPPWCAIMVDRLYLNDWNANSRIVYNHGTGYTSITHFFQTNYYFNVNNAPQLWQANSTATQFLGLPYIDSGNCTRVNTTPLYVSPSTVESNYSSAFLLAPTTLSGNQKCMHITWNGSVSGSVYAQYVSGNATGVVYDYVYNSGTGPVVSQLAAQNSNANLLFSRLSTSRHWNIGLHASASDAFKIAGSATLGTNDYLTIDTSGNVVFGNAALATTATAGFIHVPSSAGAPTGTPTSYTGRVPLEIDTTNGRLYAYYGGAWHYVSLT
ncbi:hypothetical protein T281_02585 [Rhodomicrobium udaipurense JA643]|uniref:Uncharacterized protein n=1 Tax=Rhodomicrobium udaipurense TaxID=1202716 RepID=A0A8I1KK89_9HYPH|nr:hypothetical protein [Rhodomicrobium udaipurense]KAI95966.1 hypothetical protein T281_02585 [Rhodomicrobium udaipurense JA643]MBJ7543759.1 hypothetical protein [Rhodomicrobium udaipurense]